MDAITLLTNDHRKVEALFKDYEFATERQVRRDLVDQMVKELSTHAAIEEAIFYPKVRDQVPEGKSLVDESLAEHQQMKKTLAKLDEMEVNDPNLDASVQSLMGEVKHHVSEEEAELFPKVRASMPVDRLAEMGDEMEKMKSSAPTHPHPKAPNLGAPAKAAGMAAGVADRARDAATGRKDEREVRQEVMADRDYEHPPSQRLP